MNLTEVDQGRANGGRKLSPKAKSVLQMWQEALQQNPGSETVMVCEQSISRGEADEVCEWLRYLADNNVLTGNDDAKKIPTAVLVVSTEHQELQEMIFQERYTESV